MKGRSELQPPALPSLPATVPLRRFARTSSARSLDMWKNITAQGRQKLGKLHTLFRAARYRELMLGLQHVAPGRGFSRDDFNAR